MLGLSCPSGIFPTQVSNPCLLNWQVDSLPLRHQDLDAGKDWRQNKKVAENDIVRVHHLLQGHEFKQTPSDSGGQRSLVCCSPWGCKESNWTTVRDWTTSSLWCHFPAKEGHDMHLEWKCMDAIPYLSKSTVPKMCYPVSKLFQWWFWVVVLTT